MSYSFGVTAKTREALNDAISAKLAEVLESQPVHTELSDVQALAEELVAKLRTPEADESLTASVNGSCWQQTAKEGFESVSATVNVYVGKTPAA